MNLKEIEIIDVEHERRKYNRLMKGMVGGVIIFVIYKVITIWII